MVMRSEEYAAAARLQATGQVERQTTPIPQSLFEPVDQWLGVEIRNGANSKHVVFDSVQRRSMDY